MTEQTKKETDIKIDELYEKTKGREVSSIEISDYCGITVGAVNHIARKGMRKLMPRMRYLFEE